MTNPLSYLTSRGRLLALLFVLLLGPTSAAWATSPFNVFDNVTLAPPVAGYVAPTSATAVNVIEADDAVSGALPLGFNFKFAGSSYGQVYASSNGFLSFKALGANSSGPTNNLTTAGTANVPLVAPLWDDLSGDAGTASYSTTGTAPNRVFTFEWANWKWNKTAATPNISFLCRLYEGSNRVEFAYQQLAPTSTNGSASIGLAGRLNFTHNEYVSLTSTTGTPALRKGEGGSRFGGGEFEVNTLSTPPANGQVFALVVPTGPANDECAGALTLPLTAPVTANSTNSTFSTTAPLPSCGNYQGYDVWYKVTVPSGGRLRLSATGSATSGGASSATAFVNTTSFSVYSGTCGSLAEVVCADVSDLNTGASGVEVSGRSAGEVLYVRAWLTERGSLGSTLGTAGTFTLQASDPVATWTGAESRAWNTPGNWSTGTVPLASTVVLIPNTTRQPQINSPVSSASLTLQMGASLSLVAAVSDEPAQLTVVGNLLLASGSTLAQAADSRVFIYGNLTNNGATMSLSAESALGFDHSGTAGTVQSHSLLGSATTTLPNLVLGESRTGIDALTLSSPLRISRTLVLYQGSGVSTGGRLTLLSDANGTGMIVRDGTGDGGTLGVVTGSVSVQRYIDGANRGLGYRHYSSPVSNATVGSLATAGFTPEISAAAAYNAAVDPRLVRTFPNVFAYDETRTASTTFGSALIPFDRGFVVPTSTGAVLTPGRGYDVNIDADATVTFTGPLNEGAITMDNLTRQPGAPSEHTGWHLLGNPYAAPISWNTVYENSQGIDGAVYVFQSNSQYRGSYVSFVNGLGVGEDNLAIGQGFFVRVSDFSTVRSAAATSPNVRFTEDARLSQYANPTFARGAQETRPVVQLDLVSADASREAAIVYLQEGATAGFDAKFDAYKMPTSGRASLGLLAGTTHLSISGLPATSLSANLSLPLRVSAPAAGTYRFEAPRLLNLPAGTKAYLLDAQTGARHDLSSTTAYSFQLTAAVTTSTRFSLLLTGQQALAAAPAALTAQVQLYPNPARDAFQLELPAGLARQSAATLYNSLGQAVRQYRLTAGGNSNLSLRGIAPGVYSLQLSTAQGTVSKRLVVE